MLIYGIYLDLEECAENMKELLRGKTEEEFDYFVNPCYLESFDNIAGIMPYEAMDIIGSLGFFVTKPYNTDEVFLGHTLKEIKKDEDMNDFKKRTKNEIKSILNIYDKSVKWYEI